MKAARVLKELDLIDDLDNKTLAAITSELVQSSSVGIGFKQDYPRHGMRWEDEEKQRLISLTASGMLDVNIFANEYQRRPESVITYMARLGLIEKN